ncbi:dihydromonapterin reductase [Pseudomonadota bacterium]
MNQEPILITGVGKRLGLSLARTLLSRGFSVLGTYRSDRPSLEQLRINGAVLYKCDFHDEKQLQVLLKSVTDNHKSLRAIIHNASDWLPDNHELPAKEIMKRMMQVHVAAPYQINLSLAPLLEASENSHADIIHIGDYVSSHGSKKHIAYAASKAAQDNLTYSFSAKLAPKVKVSSLAPALVLFDKDNDANYREKTLEKSLMQRVGGIDEFQHAIDYLLSSSYVTGRVLPMDGGRHLR